MKILCTTSFLDGRDRFEAGEMLSTESGQGCRVVTDEQASRFVAARWAHGEGTERGPEAAPDPARLDVHSTVKRQEARHG